MLEWLRENVSLVSAVASLATVVIWLLYLHLFYRSYRMHERPHLVIKQGHGFDLDTPCFVSNMSQQAVDVLAVLVRAERADDHVTFAAAESSERPPESRRINEPLTAGNLLELGTFRSILQQAEDLLPQGDHGTEAEEVELEVRVVALVGAQQVPRGAWRRFRIFPAGANRRVRPTDVLPQQLASRRQRRLARAWLEQAQDLQAGAPHRDDAR